MDSNNSLIERGFKCLARDEGGALFAYKYKPEKRMRVWVVSEDAEDSEHPHYTQVNDGLGVYDTIQWEDKEPTEIETLKLAVSQPFVNPIEFGGLSIHTREGGGMKIFKTDPSDEWEEYEDINHRLIRELKNYADAGVVSPEDYQKQVAYLAMGKALNKPTESNSRIYTTVTESADSVNHPAHYKHGEIETLDIIRMSLTAEEFQGFLKGNVLKYQIRAPHKHETPDEDYKKAKFYYDEYREGTE